MRTLAVFPYPVTTHEMGRDPALPLVSAIDDAVVRGDGIFETIGIDGGHLRDLDAHLARFARSARMLDLPAPDLDGWRTAVDQVAARLPADTPGSVRIVLSRGLEGTAEPTGWLTIATIEADYAGTPVRIVLLDRGYDSTVAERAPWLLAGAKTLSYGINMAAIREAHRRDADDAVFVTSDGFVLEAPTSTVIIREGAVLVTPDPVIGTLPGTTQPHVARIAADLGMTSSTDSIPVARLLAADAAWLASSVRLLSPIVAIDGREFSADRETTGSLNEALRAGR